MARTVWGAISVQALLVQTLLVQPVLVLALSVSALACGDDDAGMTMGDGGTDGAMSCEGGCDDGLFCNGEERCEAGACVGGTAPCGDSMCNEDADACGMCDADGDGADAASCGGGDCDDTNPAVFPGAMELCDPEGVDEDCDPATFGFRDRDMDGVADALCCNGETCGADCDDTNANIAPGQTEACNGMDDDCDMAVDETAMTTYYEDADGDDFGSADGATMMACAQPDGFSENDNDCDDTRSYVNPGVGEVCDDVGDNDCNPDTASPFDGDADGFDRPGEDGVCPLGNDCNDDDPDAYPGAPDVCDGVRLDCNGTPREDADEDGHVAIDDVCVGGDLPKDDCDDLDRLAFPGAQELCDGVDNDCDGDVDEEGHAGDVLPTTQLMDEGCPGGVCNFECAGTWDIGTVDPTLAPIDITLQSFPSTSSGDVVEIWRGAPGIDCASSSRCDTKMTDAGTVRVDSVQTNEVFSLRHISPAGTNTVVQHLVMPNEISAAIVHELDFPAVAGEATLVVALADCDVSVDILAGVDDQDFTIRMYDAGEAYCDGRAEQVSTIGIGLLDGRTFIGIEAPAAGRAVIVEAIGDDPDLPGAVNVLGREEVWLFPDEVSIVKMLPLRMTSPAP